MARELRQHDSFSWSIILILKFRTWTLGGYSRSALVDLITTTETTKPSFEDGVLWAVARIVELHDQPVIAADVLRESRIALNLRRVDEADRPFLKTVAQEPYFRNRRGQRS